MFPDGHRRYMVTAMAHNQSSGRPSAAAPPDAGTEGATPANPSDLPAAARRALAEAAERRRAASEAAAAPPEIGGRDGPDPARYGDWEKGGIASDF